MNYLTGISFSATIDVPSSLNIKSKYACEASETSPFVNIQNGLEILYCPALIFSTVGSKPSTLIPLTLSSR